MVRNTIQELQLIRRTAWMNERLCDRRASQADAEKITPYLVKAIVYAAALDGFLYDFEKALVAEWAMDDRVRKVFMMLQRAVRIAHDDIHKTFSASVDGFGRIYSERYDRTSVAIEDNISLTGAERYYNIVLALLRLIEKNNNLCGRYRWPELKVLTPFERRLKEVGLPYEDHGNGIMRIIDSASTNVVSATKYKATLR